MSRPRVLHLITSTGVGGAETALARLVRGLGDRYRFEVISLKPVGETGRRLRREGVQVTGMDAGGAGLVRKAFRLWLERHRPPEVVLAVSYAMWMPPLDPGESRVCEATFMVNPAAYDFGSYAIVEGRFETRWGMLALPGTGPDPPETPRKNDTRSHGWDSARSPSETRIPS